MTCLLYSVLVFIDLMWLFLFNLVSYGDWGSEWLVVLNVVHTDIVGTVLCLVFLGQIWEAWEVLPTLEDVCRLFCGQLNMLNRKGADISNGDDTTLTNNVIAFPCLGLFYSPDSFRNSYKPIWVQCIGNVSSYTDFFTSTGVGLGYSVPRKWRIHECVMLAK